MRKAHLVGTLVITMFALAACSDPVSAPNETSGETGPPLHKGNLINAWNQQVLEVAEAEDGFMTLKGLRTATMMHIAVHDALNAIKPKYTTFLPVEPQPDADPLAAATQAAYEVATTFYPDEAGRFKTLRNEQLQMVEHDAEREAGLELGTATATAIVSSRREDRWDGEADYQWHPMAPGVYAEFNEHSGTPEGFIFGAGWAKAKPFALESPSQFRSPPPPEIVSDAYTQAFNEVKQVGATRSAARTTDQSHLAMWWKDFVENSHNRLARQLVVKESLDLWRAARMFALLNMSIYDAYVSSFDNKFHYNHWRPYTAIRWASNDGNPDTTEDPEWNNLHNHTYAFPSYPSAHGTASGAATTMLADTFGHTKPITITTPQVDKAGPFSGKIPMDPVARSFKNFAAAAEECALSRVYLGIHFRYDSTEGVRLGREVGGYVVGKFLTPRAGNSED